MSITVRLLTWILGVVILGTGVAGYWTTKLSEQALIDSAKIQQQYAVQDAVHSVESTITLFSSTLDQTAASTFIALLLKNPGNAEKTRIANERLAYTIQKMPGVVVFGLLDTTGLVVASTNKAVVGTQNLGHRDYFATAMKGTPAISKPALSTSTQRPSFFMASPVTIDGKVMGVVFITVDLTNITTMFSKMVMGSKSYVFMLSSQGAILSHPNSKRIFEDVSGMDWTRTMLSQKDGSLGYTFDGIEHLAGFQKVDQTGWIVALTAARDEVIAKAIEIRNTSTIAIATLILLVALVVFIVVRSITKRLQRGVDFAETVAQGNLDNELTVTSNDELGKLSKALNSMVQKLRNMIQTANQQTAEAETQTRRAEQAMHEAEEAKSEAEKAKSQGLHEAAMRLDTIVAGIASASKELAAQIEQATRGASVQRARSEETATAMEEMNSTVIEVAKNASETTRMSDQARDKAIQGAKIVQEVVQSIANVQQKAQDMNESIEQLGEQATGIGRILSVISDIADQTNLLALNAAIEAARAGEAGRGFAVVADEVRKLAEKTMQATHEVSESVNTIQKSTLNNVAAMEDAAIAVTRSTELAKASGEALDNIVHLVEGSADQIRAIAAASEEQSATSEEISRSVEDINRIAEETSNSMHQSNQAVLNLADMAQQLHRLVEDLKSA